MSGGDHDQLHRVAYVETMTGRRTKAAITAPRVNLAVRAANGSRVKRPQTSTTATMARLPAGRARSRPGAPSQCAGASLSCRAIARDGFYFNGERLVLPNR